MLTQHSCKIAPSTYYAHRARPRSARSVRDEQLLAQIQRIFHDRRLGRALAGARKMWHLLAREQIVVARCTVERMMRAAGLRGARRDRTWVLLLKAMSPGLRTWCESRCGVSGVV